MYKSTHRRELINIGNSKHLLALTMGPLATEDIKWHDNNAAAAEGVGVFKAH